MLAEYSSLTPSPRSLQIAAGLRVLVQPSDRRIFPNGAYEEAGAELVEDLSPASVILAVKEVPIELLIPERTYVFFSHTIKAQSDNMPLLDALLERKIRQIDYECIREGGDRQRPRMVAFGRFAGIAGMIDYCRGLGERFLALGYSTPFLAVGSTYMYLSIDHAKEAIRAVGEQIAKYGLPEALCPITAVFTGRGNVSKGAQEIFELLPVRKVDPFELENIVATATGRDKTHVLYYAEATARHMVQRKGSADDDMSGGAAAGGAGSDFDSKHYYRNPELYEPIFHERVVPFTTLLINCMYWDHKYPRILSTAQARALIGSGRWRMQGVCEITCDLAGGIEFLERFSSIEDPFYIYNVDEGKSSDDMGSEGLLFHAVDHLPSECPREASMHFSEKLTPFLPALARSDGSKPFSEQDDVPIELRAATITDHGKLTPDFEYIEKLRQANLRADSKRATIKRTRNESFISVRLQGHLFDSGFINRALDLVEDSPVSARILEFNVGKDRHTTTDCLLQLFAPTPKSLDTVLKKLRTAASSGGMGLSVGGTAGDESRFAIPRVPSLPPKRILLLGAGMVTPPLVEYLLRRPNNCITCASFIFSEAEALAKGKPRVSPMSLNVMDEPDKLSAAVFQHDIVVSLVPAFMHLPVIKAGLVHKKHVVTASYVSDEIAAVNDAAAAAGVTVLMESGLDPGIDHLSACKMIQTAKAEGCTVNSFKSLCGGLPAPECSDNPLAYKFSWNPRGVLTAAGNSAQYRKNGEIVNVDGADLMLAAEPCHINPALALEVIPNRNSVGYAEKYEIEDSATIFRGTLRFGGFCRLIDTFKRLGLTQAEKRPYLEEGSPKLSCRSLMQQLVGAPADASDDAIIDAAMAKAEESGAPPFSAEDRRRLAECITWLGMLSAETPVPQKGTPLDAFTAVLSSKEEMKFHPGERDMVVMHHELIVTLPSGEREMRTGTLVEYGNESGSAMARTVGLTAAIGCQLVLDGVVAERGVCVPTTAVWYDPMLEYLADEGIALKEKTLPAPSVES